LIKCQTEEKDYKEKITYLQGFWADTVYHATLTVQNVCGLFKFNDSIHVDPLPIAWFGIDYNSQCNPMDVEIYNTSRGAPTKYLWQFTPEFDTY